MSLRSSRTRATSPVLRPGTNALFVGKDPRVREVYERIQSALRSVGRVTTETKKTSIHLVAGGVTGTAFAGVHPQKSAVLLNVRSAKPIRSSRVRKIEQVSKNRFHNELLLDSPDDVNAELLRWLKAAYKLASHAE